jgi:hypothetical protein
MIEQRDPANRPDDELRLITELAENSDEKG